MAGGVVPEVEAPEGSGFAAVALGTEVCLGRVPDVDGVGNECGLLAVVELAEPVLAGVAGVGAGAGGAAGGAALTNVLVGRCSCGHCCPIVLEFWHSVFFSSQESVDV